MKTIPIVLDKKLLAAADRAARQMKKSRSAFIREALQEHLRRFEVRAMEDRDRRGYALKPQAADEWRPWEKEAYWPSE